MDQVPMDYSPKNIPVHSNKEYRLNLINKTRSFVRNMKWKAYFYLNPNKREQSKNTYGFKSANNPPPVASLKEFEDGMVTLVQNVKFKKHSNTSCAFLKTW